MMRRSFPRILVGVWLALGVFPLRALAAQVPDSAAIAALASIWLVLVVVFLAIFILQLVMAWRIAVKAGFSGPLSL